MRVLQKKTAGGLALILLLAACGGANQEVILPGERLDLRGGDVAATTVASKSQAIRLPKQIINDAWTHRAGNQSHSIQHPAFGETATLAWSADIGEGNSRKQRITADPVAEDGRIFTLDAQARVTATSTSGQTLWTADLTPPGESAGDASGGGLAVLHGKLYITTGFGALTALDAASGELIWRQQLESAASGAPTVYEGTVYVVSNDSRAWAIDTEDGRVRWQRPGVASAAGVVGGAGPAVNRRIVVFPTSSGEIVTSFRKGGVQLWAGTVSGQRKGRAYANVSDITADPVIIGDTIYAGNQSGRVVAMDTTTGERKWTAREGAYSPLWITGGSVFLVSDQGELVRLSARTGERIWGTQLPYFETAKIKKRKAIYANFGPVLAGGQLWVASSDGMLRAFSPEDGALSQQSDLPGGASTNPIVVDQVLYVVSADGKLLAYR
ncbi:PQQ-like beta-propeller repeat protein [Candidatus Halocynthiibacter alkanivorans]|uniref:PQQ-like beta-propeller repeat protein n=1 Tax=Candidatus Halocynthiibacter alkanivorans TaxID=2267619 RepID=UPI000DF1A5A1|nr:PQQ-like beta-propeller repeat protein [Candidatus Halocynthiibacter alkanivorans]